MKTMHKQENEGALSSRSLDDKAFDLFGEMLLAHETDALLAEIDAERTDGSNADYDAFVERSRKKNLKAIDAYVRRQKLRRYMKPLRIAGEVAAIAVLTLSLAVAAVAGNRTVRIQMMQLLATHEKEYTELRLQADENASFDVPAEWKGMNYPASLPEGLEVEEVDAHFDSNHVLYSDARHPDRILRFSEYGPDTTVNVDTENAVLTPFTIRGHSATLFTKENRVGAYWADGQHFFLIMSTDIDESAIRRMAESVTQVN